MSTRKKTSKKRKKSSHLNKVYTWGPPVFIMALAFILRVVWQWEHIFREGTVFFRGVDPWYHMRLVDYTVNHFPKPLIHDPYALYPDGWSVGFHPVLTWLVSGAAWIVGLGNPSQHTVDVVGAFIPPIILTIMIIPVYLIGRNLFSHGVGVFAALVVAILPGELFHRSLLGFTDHHILETFFMTTTILFVILARKKQQYRYSALAGISLGLYLLNWLGGTFFTWILWVWLVVQFLVDVRAGRDISFLCKSSLLMFTISFLMFIPYTPYSAESKLQEFAAGISILLPLILLFLRNVLHLNSTKTTIVLVAGTSIVLMALYVEPKIYFQIRDSFLMIFWGWGSTIHEAKPLNLAEMLHTYNVILPLAAIGLAVAIKRKENPLFIIWCIVMLLAAIGERRWGYYFAVNAALLSSYLVYAFSSRVKEQAKLGVTIVICFFIVMPVMRGTYEQASAPNNINLAWYNTMVWLRENTPPPFGEDLYYEPQDGITADYSVLAWWDYGHWITRIAKRVPLATPALQNAGGPAQFITATTYNEAREIVEEYNVKYIIIDYQLVHGKFYATLFFAGKEAENLREARDKSMAWALYTRPMPGYKLVRNEGGIKVFEVIEEDLAQGI